MADSHLMAVARQFQSELTQYGLQPMALQEEQAERDGWWIPIANWRRNRPHIGVFYDKLPGDGQRHFWFGFYSTKLGIKRLCEVMPKDLQNFAVVTDADFKSNEGWTADARTRVRNANGLVYEQYEDDDHYFGKMYIMTDGASDE